MKLDVSSLAHTKWECKYHIVFALKYRRQVIWEDKARHRSDVKEIVRIQGSGNNRGARNAGSYPYDGEHTAE